MEADLHAFQLFHIKGKSPSSPSQPLLLKSRYASSEVLSHVHLSTFSCSLNLVVMAEL